MDMNGPYFWCSGRMRSVFFSSGQYWAWVDYILIVAIVGMGEICSSKVVVGEFHLRVVSDGHGWTLMVNNGLGWSCVCEWLVVGMGEP